ncbi:MAG: maleylpyruvate isomerase family mycothiol-dependent enzyme, partial [Candidatus Dormiibacterota bacterium]
LRHLGHVHRWALRYVAEGLTEMLPEVPEAEMVGQGPPDAELAAWLELGARELAAALRRAPADLECWSFLPAPSPLLFWARRQAHETAIHRVDGELAGGALSAIPGRFAADGLNELFFGFVHRRRHRLRCPWPASVLFQATDSGDSWRLGAGSQGLTVESGPGEAATVVRGDAAQLYLLGWNRLGAEAVSVAGPGEFLGWWREAVHINWT